MKQLSYRIPEKVFLVLVFTCLALTAFSQQTIQGNWGTQADAYRGKNGQRFTFTFPAGGTLSGSLWGTDLYTDDSSIAKAAVHAGLISAQNGGTVTIEIRAGASSYQGTARNGVTSQGYGAWSGSFVFVSGGSAVITPVTPSNAIQGSWGTQADAYRGKNGQRYTFTFPAGGTLSARLWGTDLYTDDSSIATAAVHAGLISVQSGGTVTIEIRAGYSTYKGSTRNGVTSQAYGPYSGSFVFISGGSAVITPVTPVTPSGTINGNWGTQASAYRGKNGQRYTFTFPAGGTLSGGLWGTDLYTDDSSIATAAVHAGLITVQNGGTVTIEIRAGASAYQGSTRNGVSSRGYGSFSGSFVFVSGGAAVITPVTPSGTINGNWGTQASAYRGKNGQRYTFTFPAGGTLSGGLWGTDLYTDDSSIATAAVHAGLITVQNGGTVTIEIRAGASAYQGSTRNGVSSRGYGSFSGSFVFVSGGAAVITPVTPSGTINGNWGTQASAYRGKNGQRYTFTFPAGGTLSGGLWGTDLYTDDSSIATAAVHAGLITVQNGGTVTIEIRAGASAYQGSTRNGVSSRGYGSFSGSFVFVSGGAAVITPVTPSGAINGNWGTQADTYRGKNGQRYTFSFPAGGTLSGRVWGTDLYTDDSSIASAAVHAGLISVQNGGTVTIEIRAGAPGYQGSNRNGVTSTGYGAWHGSFVFVRP